MRSSLLFVSIVALASSFIVPLHAGITINSLDGTKMRLEITPDKTSPGEGDTVIFQAKYDIQPANATTWTVWPANLKLLQWTATSATGSLMSTGRVKVDQTAGKLTLTGVNKADKEISVIAKFKANDFDVVWAEARVTVKIPPTDNNGNNKPVIVVDPDREPKPALPADFVHAIRGAGKFPANTRVELTVAFKKDAEGSKGVTIDWYFHGKLLKANQPKLVIAKLATADTGTYTAKVTRKEDGKKDEASAAVTIAK